MNEKLIKIIQSEVQIEFYDGSNREPIKINKDCAEALAFSIEKYFTLTPIKPREFWILASVWAGGKAQLSISETEPVKKENYEEIIHVVEIMKGEK